MRVSRDRVRKLSAQHSAQCSAQHFAQHSARSFRALRVVALLGGLLLGAAVAGPALVPATANAQDAGAGAGTTGRETEFVAMTGPARESVPGGALLVSAYAAILLLLAAYVGRLALQQASTSKELARLDAALRARSGGEAPAKSKAEPTK
jgi:hypothetical protein